MFVVPVDDQHPSFDRTFTVGFVRWLTSSAADRREWVRRRNTAAQLAWTDQRQRIAERVPAPPPSRARHAAQPVHRPSQVDLTTRTLSALARVELRLASIQFAAVLIPLTVVLMIIAAVVWILLP